MRPLKRLVKPALWIVAIFALSRSIAATKVFFSEPTLAGWAGAIGWPLIFIAAFFGLSLFEYAKLRRQGKIKRPNRLYERLTGGTWPPEEEASSSEEQQNEKEDI